VSAQKVSFFSLQTFPAAVRSIKISADMYCTVRCFHVPIQFGYSCCSTNDFIGCIETSAAEMNELEKASVSCYYLHRIAEHGGVDWRLWIPWWRTNA